MKTALLVDIDTFSCSHYGVCATEYAQALKNEFGSDYELEINFPNNTSQGIFDLAVSRVGFNSTSDSESEMDIIYDRIGLVFIKLSRNQ